MAQQGECLGFAGKAFREAGSLRHLRRKDFEGDEAIKMPLAGLVHRAHTALPDEFENFELRKLFAHIRGLRRDEFRARLVGRRLCRFLAPLRRAACGQCQDAPGANALWSIRR